MSNLKPIGLPNAEIPNDLIAGSARQFRETADFLYDHLTEHDCVLPLLMVAAFGIELFLKSLNSVYVYQQDEILASFDVYRVTATPSKKWHHLTKLFDDLDDYIREGLGAAYETSPANLEKAKLRDVLDKYDNLFVDSRYPFEAGLGHSGMSITNLVGLLGFFGDYVGALPKQIR